MPTYEYKCTEDNSTFELWQEVGSPAPACPTCGAPTKKVFHPARVIFKGSGFYVTDLRAEKSASVGSSANSSSTPAAAPAPAPAATETAPSPAPAKTESAPASTAPATK